LDTVLLFCLLPKFTEFWPARTLGACVVNE
jgi:hypothetical protein